jgi:ADP-ribose pyrophosphatase YjhB (NUDIX family)
MTTFNKLLYQIYKLPWAITRPVTVGVRVMLIKDGQVLLVRHTYQDGWFMVGGGVKRNETLEESARREAREEVEAEIGELHLFGAYSNFIDHLSDHIVVFTCNEFKLTGKTDFEIAEARFFPMEALPEDIIPGHRRRIQEYLSKSDRLKCSFW